MTSSDANDSAAIGAVPLAQARIDWGHGRIIGFSVPADDALAFDVVQLWLDGRCVASAVANLSVFDFARDLAGLNLPSREHSAFELRIPQAALLPGQIGDGMVALEVRTTRGAPVLATSIQGLHELLRLTDGAPVDLLYQVRFHGLAAGALQGCVVNLHGVSQRPALLARLNDQGAEPLAFYESAADGSVHHFSIPVRIDRLVNGVNQISVVGPDGQPLGSYPIQIGVATLGESERKLAALEAEVAFLKRLVLTQNPEALPARLALLKSEIVNICSEMMTLQRTNFEREWLARPAAPAPAPAPAVAAPTGVATAPVRPIAPHAAQA
ncbi:MAG TPA: hypothetical protein VFY73_24725 [Ideonella sp.]|jgi:hypothetical protein|uniref:hypothetical protein n=1 Tax=Ideonella sp. TaxID=1929293 RepID=UPI002E340C0E|nr:hypothetical protein [Ideonella sp.]HEX5687233.1 hypothetical protein [Ideonella sp.]